MYDRSLFKTRKALMQNEHLLRAGLLDEGFLVMDSRIVLAAMTRLVDELGGRTDVDGSVCTVTTQYGAMPATIQFNYMHAHERHGLILSSKNSHPFHIARFHVKAEDNFTLSGEGSRNAITRTAFARKMVRNLFHLHNAHLAYLD